MRYPALFCALITGAVHADDLIIPGDHIGSLSLGTELSTLESRMGGAAQRGSLASYRTERWKTEGGECGVAAMPSLGDSVISRKVWTTSAKFTSPEGLSVGSTLAAIQGKFPTLHRVTPLKPRDGEPELYDVLEQGIAFEFAAPATSTSRVIRIIVHAPGTNPSLRSPTDAELRLDEAAKSGDLKSARQALDDGADPSMAFDWAGWTPLFHAVNASHTKIVRLLLARGAWVDTQDTAAQTPLALAIEQKNPEMLRLLLAQHASPFWRARGGASLMSEAALAGNTDAIALLAERHVPVNSANITGFTPLHAASLASNVDAVRMLIKLGADVNARQTNGATPLLVAMQSVPSRRSFISHHEYADATAVVKALLAAGAKPDAEAISFARRNELEDIVKLLQGK